MSDAFARRYQLLERIAIGGTAEVFRARFLTGDGEGRPVVIKRVLPQFARDERFRRLFHEEACVTVTMVHPNIVRVLDHGDTESTCYIALELVEGMDLGSLLDTARGSARLPTPNLAAYLVAQIADALQFIHDQTSSEGLPLHVIHRDVSPQNILVSYAGEVKLTDFGIAKSAIRRERTVDGTLRGKLDYMPPEQATLGVVDHRADIFGLGCVLYEMLEGAPPFRGENEIETLERVRQGRLRRQPEELPLPVDLQQILRRVLQPRREERYQRAAELAADLRQFPFSAEELGRWVSEVADQPAVPGADRVDEAVRALLGESIDDPRSTGVRRGGTTVFAGVGAGKTTAANGAARAPAGTAARGSRHLWLALVAVAALGLLGWGLWALRLLRTPVATIAPVADAFLSTRHEVAVPSEKDGSLDHSPLRTDAGQPSSGHVVWVRSSPTGALVLVEGRLRGRTPLRLELPRAPCLLELQKEGRRSWRRRLSAGQLGERIDVTLPELASHAAANGAYLTINSMPWSRVFLDGRFAGNTPLLNHQVRIGAHRVELLGSDGVRRKLLQISLQRGERRSFTFDLNK